MAATKAQILELALDLPALAAPPGLTHNFVNPPNLKTAYYIDVAICMTVSSLVVCMRIWTKARLIRKFGREDWVCLLAFTLFGAYCAYAFYVLGKVVHVGVHQWNMKVISFSESIYYFWIGSIIYGFTVFTIKLAILLEFLRIFSPGKNHSTCWIYHSLIWLNFSFYIIVISLWTFQCQPIEKSWKPWIDGQCLKKIDTYIAGACFNSASDILLLILPQRVIWNLQMSVKKRIGVSAIFLVGLFACFTSLSQIYYCVQFTRSGDRNYNTAFIGFWTFGELTSGFLSMCLPVSPKFYQSLKEITVPSLIPIARPSLRRSFKDFSDGDLPQFRLPRKSDKPSILEPVKQESSSVSKPVGPVGVNLASNDSSISFAKLEPGNSHVLRCIEISTKYE